MSGFVTVLRREVVERRMVVLLGLALGLLPFAALPLFHPGPEAQALTSVLLVFAFAWGTALVLGATAYAPDLADRRAAFYFARPLSPTAIMGGKLAGAALVVLLGAALVVLPALLLGRLASSAWTGGPSAGTLWLLAVGTAVLLLPIGNAAGTILRSRKAWVAVDAAGFALVALAGALVVRWIGPSVGGPVVATGLAVAAPIAFLGAAFAEAASGRGDAQRAHRALSLTAWGILVPVAFALAAGVAWFVNPSPSALSSVELVQSAPSGSWVTVSGTVKHRGRNNRWTFLVDSRAPSRHLALHSSWWATTISENGSTAAWIQPSDPAAWLPWSVASGTEAQVAVARLGDDPAQLPLAIGFGHGQGGFALSPSGARLAVVTRDFLQVFDVASRRLVSAASPKGQIALDPEFAGEDRVTLLGERSGNEVPIFWFDLKTRRLDRTGAVDLSSTKYFQIARDRSSERILVVGIRGPVELCDGVTGRRLARLAENGSAAFLADGRVVVTTAPAEGRHELRVFSREGVLALAAPLDVNGHVRPVSQPSADTVLVNGVQFRDGKVTEARVLEVALATGRVLRTSRDVQAVGNGSWAQAQPTLPGAEAAKLFVTASRDRLVRIEGEARAPVLP